MDQTTNSTESEIAALRAEIAEIRKAFAKLRDGLVQAGIESVKVSAKSHDVLRAQIGYVLDELKAHINAGRN